MTKEEIQKNSEHWYNKYKDAEKRIEELEGQVTRAFEVLEGKRKRIEELEKQISILLSCKDCPENKGGYICEKEYNDKCLAQKIQYIKELKEEHKQNEIDLIISNSSARAELNDQLAQAKEIIKDLLDIANSNVTELKIHNKIVKQAEQFLEK